MERPPKDPYMNSIENFWDSLEPFVGIYTPPPTNHREVVIQLGNIAQKNIQNLTGTEDRRWSDEPEEAILYSL